MDNFKRFLESLGTLHDARINRVDWHPHQETITFEIEDLYSNFRGLDEYKGPEPGVIQLNGVTKLAVHVDLCDKSLKIYEFLIRGEDGDQKIVSISFWPSGKLEATFSSSTFPQLRRI